MMAIITIVKNLKHIILRHIKYYLRSQLKELKYAKVLISARGE